jgi:hypothetical protein
MYLVQRHVEQLYGLPKFQKCSGTIGGADNSEMLSGYVARTIIIPFQVRYF